MGSQPAGNHDRWRGLHIRTEDIAKFGQLCLQKGAWNGKQLVLPAWVEQVTGKQVSNSSDPENVVWDKLLPALPAAPLAPDPGEEAKLKQTLSNLAVCEGHTANAIKLPGT